MSLYAIVDALSGIGSDSIVPSGKIGLGFLPADESNPFLLRMSFIAYHRLPIQDLSFSGHRDGGAWTPNFQSPTNCKFRQFGRQRQYLRAEVGEGLRHQHVPASKVMSFSYRIFSFVVRVH